MKVGRLAHEKVSTLRLMAYIDEEMEDTRDDAPQISQESELVDGSASQNETSLEPPAVASGGRRRGRRKVMKKKTIKDEEGYLGLYYESVEEIGELMLTCSPSSDKRGASLGVLFRGRIPSSKTEDACIHCNIVNGKGQEVRWKARAGQYHEFLREEIKCNTGRS